MSYDIALEDRVTGNILEVDTPHQIRGGTYCVGGTRELWLNITYNYSGIFCRKDVFGENGIRTIYGMTGAESIPVLQKAINALKNDVSDDYWEPTEGNAKQALYGLLAFAQMRPDGIWGGD